MTHIALCGCIRGRTVGINSFLEVAGCGSSCFPLKLEKDLPGRVIMQQSMLFAHAMCGASTVPGNPKSLALCSDELCGCRKKYATMALGHTTQPPRHEQLRTITWHSVRHPATEILHGESQRPFAVPECWKVPFGGVNLKIPVDCSIQVNRQYTIFGQTRIEVKTRCSAWPGYDRAKTTDLVSATPMT